MADSQLKLVSSDIISVRSMGEALRRNFVVPSPISAGSSSVAANSVFTGLGQNAEIGGAVSRRPLGTRAMNGLEIPATSDRSSSFSRVVDTFRDRDFILDPGLFLKSELWQTVSGAFTDAKFVSLDVDWATLYMNAATFKMHAQLHFHFQTSHRIIGDYRKSESARILVAGWVEHNRYFAARFSADKE